VDGWNDRGITEYTFAEVVASQYNIIDGCLESIWDAADLLDTMGTTDTANQTLIVETFNFCNHSALLPYPSSVFIYGLEGLPQQNYPYPVGGLPSWPVNAVCEIMTNTSLSLLQRAAHAAAMSVGYDLKGPCLKTLEEGPGSIPGDGPGLGSWGYQSCTETMHLFSSRARSQDKLGLRNYNITNEIPILNDLCRKLYQVVPNTKCLADRYGGFDIARTTSNTIFSSGMLDPWGGAAITERDGGEDATNRGVYFFSMPNGAHHLDLRGWNDADPPDVVETRNQEEKIITEWIEEWVVSRQESSEFLSSPKTKHDFVLRRKNNL
jgi:hypothetical protein